MATKNIVPRADNEGQLGTAAKKWTKVIATDLTLGTQAVSQAGKDLIDDANAAAQLTTLGLTTTAAELNALDGITATVTELNYTDGVTSAIQTQFTGKAASSHTHALAAGATDVTATATELNTLDGITATVAELNYTDGVTSNIQTQLGTKGAGTVTGVSGTAPVASSGGTTPAISMAAATASVNGYMTSTYASKLDGIAAGATANAGTVTGVSGTAPVASSGGTTPAISMAAATATVNGYMTNTYAAKLNGIAASANNYVHPSTAGNIHVPTAGATGNILQYQGTSGTAKWIALSSDVTVADGGAMTIAAAAVTLAKMANMATASLIYRKTAAAGAPEVQTLATLKTDLSLTGTNSGDQTLPTLSSLGAVSTGDSRLSDARPASDVYTWAKAATKPTYSAGEVGAATLSYSNILPDTTIQTGWSATDASIEDLGGFQRVTINTEGGGNIYHVIPGGVIQGHRYMMNAYGNINYYNSANSLYYMQIDDLINNYEWQSNSWSSKNGMIHRCFIFEAIETVATLYAMILFVGIVGDNFLLNGPVTLYDVTTGIPSYLIEFLNSKQDIA